ncbi:hypothetical protein PGB90_010585 [Kerria lacca]
MRADCGNSACARVSSLKNVRILAAEAVRSGDSMYLVCEYDLENIPLYSIKWYFNLYEFYSFIPKEIPPKRVFLVPGITVDDKTAWCN